MKRCIIFVVFSLTVFGFGILFGTVSVEPEPQSTETFSQTKNTPSPSGEDRVFLLVSNENTINIFTVSDQKEPYLYSTIEYIDLNSIDSAFKNALLHGVSLKGETALANYIQDLDS